MMIRLLALLAAILVGAGAARAQSAYDVPFTRPAPGPAAATGPMAALTPGLEINPVEILSSAASLLPQGGGGGAAAGDGERTRGLSTVLNIMLLMTVIALAPSIILMTTCFVRILVVLSLLRQAVGTQSLPPPQVTTGLAIFMTLLVMAPTADRIYNEAIVPYQRHEINDYQTLWDKAKQPLRDFMFDQIEASGNWSSLYMVLNYRGVDTSKPEALKRSDVDMIALVPAYMLSELKTSFLMGFRVYLPFLVIDMVISTMLISMSMMMLPPVLVSLPFKLLLFVLVDGWQLVVGSLMNSFVQPGSPAHAAATPILHLIAPGFA
jgi:flagellar biosynthetic protein FliP